MISPHPPSFTQPQAAVTRPSSIPTPTAQLLPPFSTIGHRLPTNSTCKFILFNHLRTIPLYPELRGSPRRGPVTSHQSTSHSSSRPTHKTPQPQSSLGLTTNSLYTPRVPLLWSAAARRRFPSPPLLPQPLCNHILRRPLPATPFLSYSSKKPGGAGVPVTGHRSPVTSSCHLAASRLHSCQSRFHTHAVVKHPP
jgi:hypothetical protein